MTVKARWLGRLATRIALERAARARHVAKPTAQTRALLQRRKDQVAEARRVLRRHSRPKIRTAEQIGLQFENTRGPKGTIYRGAGHHSAGGRAKNMRQLTELAISFHRAHKALGGGGLAYEALVADDGSIVLGNPTSRKSDGVAKSNTGLINICVPGTTGDRMTAAQRDSIRWLLANWHTSEVPARHRIPKSARTLEWRGHKEWFNNSACPGTFLADYKALWS